MPEAVAIHGVSASVLALRDYLPKVASSRATVLITGETGTGKQRVAEAVHALSARRDGPFVSLNCAALSDEGVERELFGYGGGGGLYGEADGGTLFLDEIDELPPPGQARLLRAIEAPRTTRSEPRRPPEARIVAASSQPLDALVEARRFRPDLFYRLNVAQLVLPPLRERREDVPVLLRSMTEELNARDGQAVGGPDADLLACLMAHDWPGNLRELRNLIEVLFIDPPCGAIAFADLPPAYRTLFEPYRRSGVAERDRLLDALQATHWNKSEAAKSLQWSRMTLYRKLAQYDIDKGPHS